MALIWGAAERRETGVLEGPAVIMRLPLAVHLTAASWTCGGETSPNFLLRVSQISSGRGRLSPGRLKCARSTTRLGLGGLDPATAEYVRWGCFAFSPFFCFWRELVVGPLEGELPLLRHSTALESMLRVSWICLSSRFCGGLDSTGAGVLLWPSNSLMIGWAMKERRWGEIIASLLEGSVEMMALRMLSKLSLGDPSGRGTVGTFDMMVVRV